MGSSNPGCLKFLNYNVSTKKQVTRNDQFLFCIKKMSFSGSPKGTPHDWCRRTMKKNYPEAKKCSICWVSHMFSIWEYRYSYGICFGTVYALQNSTPNILSFFSVHTRRVEIGHILCRRSWLYIYIYIYPMKSPWNIAMKFLVEKLTTLNHRMGIPVDYRVQKWDFLVVEFYGFW